MRLTSVIAVSMCVSALCISADEARSDATPKTISERPVATNALPAFTAISAKGFIHSTERGFKFPDGTVQTTASTGVSSVNSVTGTVTIVGDDATSVTTTGNTIRVSSQATYRKTRIVSPVGVTFPDPLASGTALLNMLASIDDASATDRYLLKIEPGIYDLGANQLLLKPFVDIEGSGPGSTLILTARGSNADLGTAESGVVAAGSTELRDLSIRNVTTAAYASALWVQARNFRLSNVVVRSEGALFGANGVLVHSGDLDASRVEVYVSGSGSLAQPGGVAVIGSGPAVNLTDSRVSTLGTADYATGMVVNSGTAVVTIDDTTITATATTTRSTGLDVVAGSVIAMNATMSAAAAPERYAVKTGSSGNLTIHNSRLLAGNVWNNAAILAAKGTVGSTVLIHSSMLDSAANDTACYQSSHLAGTLSKTCIKEL